MHVNRACEKEIRVTAGPATCRTPTATYGIAGTTRRGAWRSLGARIAGFIQKLIDEHRARHDLGTLESLSDRDLRDIGLRRGDIEFELRRDYSSLAEILRF